MLSGKVGSNFVGETEWCKTITASEFELCDKRLVKLNAGNFVLFALSS